MREGLVVIQVVTGKLIPRPIVLKLLIWKTSAGSVKTVPVLTASVIAYSHTWRIIASEQYGLEVKSAHSHLTA
jgi:hypothetical protein